MWKKVAVFVSLFAFVACGDGGGPTQLAKVAKKPNASDIGKMCNIQVARASAQIDAAADAGFEEMSRLGVTKKDVKAARAVREKASKEYDAGARRCCDMLKKEAGRLSKTQRGYLYGQIVAFDYKTLDQKQTRDVEALLTRTRDDLTFGELREIEALRKGGKRCQDNVSATISRRATSEISNILKKY
ncbi:MAG: hypothetical protein AAGF15_08505 [Pseudomonadota bacterium]